MSKCVIRFLLISRYIRDIMTCIGNWEKSRCGLPPTKEVRLMIETYLLENLYIIFYALLGMTITAAALVIVLVIIMCKGK